MMAPVTDMISAGKLPRDLLPWQSRVGYLNATLLKGTDAGLFDAGSWSGIHLVDENGYGGYTVMDDSDGELRRHIHAARLAQGRVLKTGLGFGCFVRMALLNDGVEHIDVIEKDQEIAAHFGAPFKGDHRVTIHVADAFKFPLQGRKWDFAWHDIYCDGNLGLGRLHVKLMMRYRKAARIQGAWALERWARRALAEKGVATF